MEKVIRFRKGQPVEILKSIALRNSRLRKEARLARKKERFVAQIVTMCDNDADKAKQFIETTYIPQANLPLIEVIRRGRFSVLERFLKHKASELLKASESL